MLARATRSPLRLASFRPPACQLPRLRHRSAHAAAGPAAHARRTLLGAYERYDGLLKTHRLATTMTSGVVLAFAGDAFTQAATLPVYDGTRGVAFSLFGGFITGRDTRWPRRDGPPVNYLWLSKLDELVRYIAPRGGWRAVACKVGVQTFFFQPVVYVPLFFCFSAVFRGWSADVAVERVRAEYGPTITSLWAFWTPICVFTFAYMPVRQQAIFFSAISLAWNALLSFLSNRPKLELPRGEQLVADGADGASGPRLLRHSSSGRLLSHQPPMGILDGDLSRPPSPGPSTQSIIGFLLGPGLM